MGRYKVTSKCYAILREMLFSALTSMNFLETVREHAIKQ